MTQSKHGEAEVIKEKQTGCKINHHPPKVLTKWMDRHMKIIAFEFQTVVADEPFFFFFFFFCSSACLLHSSSCLTSEPWHTVNALRPTHQSLHSSDCSDLILTLFINTLPFYPFRHTHTNCCYGTLYLYEEKAVITLSFPSSFRYHTPLSATSRQARGSAQLFLYWTYLFMVLLSCKCVKFRPQMHYVLYY